MWIALDRRALRRALPLLLIGLVVLGAALGGWTAQHLAPERTPRSLVALVRIAGATGSATFLVGLLELMRVRISHRPSAWFALAFLAWVGEFALRLQSALAPGLADARGLDLAVRVLLGAVSISALSSGFLWAWDEAPPAGESASWRGVRRAFAAQLCVFASLWVGAVVHGADRAPGIAELLAVVPFHIGPSLAWLAFVGPYVLLFRALSRTARVLARAETTRTILTAPAKGTHPR